MFNYFIIKISRYLGVTLILLTILASCKNQSKKEASEHKYTNALINETSPYLLQHAHNPVDWRAWSQDALDEAKEQNKLVLVSIGYSSCHWCHVMEEETFENDSIAQLMNANFVNIKVDREERPDVDQIYMTAVQLMKGNGGWPLNVITLPNGKPLYGGTYHTKEQWKKVLTEISRLYNEDPEKAAQYSDMVAKGIQEVNLIAPSDDFTQLNKEVIFNSIRNWKPLWDEVWGGDTREEKFMLPSNLDFLIDYALLAKDEAALEHVERTLDKIALGGIYDHIGGGFFRYSTDSKWKVPHFEKMLYDNAQALSLYSKAYQVFKKPLYKEVILGTIEFLEREMKNPEGGYYAALDADSEGEEGKFYVWTVPELKLILANDFELFAAYYTIEEQAVWEKENYVLHRLMDDTQFLEEHPISKSALENLKIKWKTKLMKARAKRIRPRTDDKILTSWNALLMNGYLKAYTALGTGTLLDNSEGILQFVLANSYQNEQLGHSYKKDSKHIDAFLEDYSLLANAALNLYSATLNTQHLTLAQELTRTAQQKFNDQSSGMYTYNEGDKLIAKLIKTDDGVIPSSNAIMAHNLFQLGHMLYNKDDLEKSKTMVSSMVGVSQETPYSYAKWNSLLLNMSYPFYEVAVVGENAESVIKNMGANHVPNILLVGSTTESNLPLFEGRFSEDGTFIYVCQDNTCKLPVKTVEEALHILDPPKTYARTQTLDFNGFN
ncbi:thioredoxin domain-containing protein [Maribacter sp. R77961]|uniref:thioredoxin domain-containing protein n=1 Tax=Maribacter sp. R77961 TaxID=3093871 RepID=UPI0037CB89A3